MRVKSHKGARERLLVTESCIVSLLHHSPVRGFLRLGFHYLFFSFFLPQRRLYRRGLKLPIGYSPRKRISLPCQRCSRCSYDIVQEKILISSFTADKMWFETAFSKARRWLPRALPWLFPYPALGAQRGFGINIRDNSGEGKINQIEIKYKVFMRPHPGK